MAERQTSERDRYVTLVTQILLLFYSECVLIYVQECGSSRIWAEGLRQSVSASSLAS